MSKKCPIRNERVLYLECLECDIRAKCNDLKKETQKKVRTNIGEMPIEDYLDILAMQGGFDDYEDMRAVGYEINSDSI